MKIPFIISILIYLSNFQKIVYSDTEYKSKLSSNNSAYYSFHIPKTVESTTILIITATTNDYYSQPQIDISEFYDRPSSDNSQVKCISYSINSCAKDNLVPDTWIYFSIYCLYDCNYNLILTLSPAIQITFEMNYYIYLQAVPSALLVFRLDKLHYELKISITEQSIYNPQIYYAYLAKDYVPNGEKFDKKAYDFGIFSKIFKFKQDQLSLNSTYYILIQGKVGTVFQLAATAVEQNQSNIFFLNQTSLDFTQVNKTYDIVFPSTSFDQIYLQIHSNFGNGKFEIKYCLDAPMIYENTLGDILILIIYKDMRDQCKLSLANQNITENMTIKIIPYQNSEFGYLISTYEGYYQMQIVINQKIYSQIRPNITKNHSLFIPLRETINISLFIQIYAGDPKFQLSYCYGNLPCVPTLLKQRYTIFHFDPINCLRNCSLLLTVYNSTIQSQYSFIFRNQGYHIRLFQSSLDFNFVLLNQFQYYNLTALSLVNVSSVTIKISPVTGEMRILTSQSINCPTLSDLFNQNSDVKTSQNGTITYFQNLQKPIYIGVLGQLAGFFYIRVHTEKSQNAPSNYQLLLENINNQYIINKNPLLLKYIPKKTPYQIKFSPLPGCISYGPTLPLNTTCMQLPVQFYQPIFINITGNRIDSILSISISTGYYQLSENKPIFIICNNNCSEIIKLNINKQTRIIHSGQGKIFNNQTNQQISNGILNVNCKTTENLCEKILIAQMNSTGNMMLNIQEDVLTPIHLLPKSTTLTKLPRQFYYKLPKNGPTVITVDSKGAVIDMYVNIQILNQNYSNLLYLIYPTNSSYDLKQIGDPFRRIYMIQIQKQLLSTLGCFKNNVICIATVSLYLNQNYQYSEDFLKNGVIFISASSSVTKLQQNTPYRTRAAYKIQYYEYASTLSKNFTILLQPLSNCNPFLIHSNQSNTYPTLDHYTLLSYQKLTLKNTKEIIIGVVVQDQCLFDLILLSDNHYRNMIAGFPQKIQLLPSNTQYFIYNSKNELGIQIDSAIDVEMYANVIPYNKNPDFYLPNRTSYQFFSKVSPLIIQSNNSANYVIAIVNPNNWTIQTNIIIKQQNQSIMLVHNIQYSSKYIENESSIYKYTSANSFKIYFTSQGGVFQIIVSDSHNNIKMFDISSQDQILIQNVDRFQQFMIQVIGSNGAKYTIQIIEIGSQARPTLFPGLPFTDMFTSYPQSNYYTFTGNPSSNKPFSLSFRYSQSYINSLKAKGYNISSVEPIFSYEFKGIGEKIQKMPKLIRSYEIYQGVTYQIQQQYGKYVFCFQNKNKENNYKDYNIILSSQQISYLINSIPLFIQTSSNLDLRKYETFTTEPSTLIVQLHTCQGKAQLTGASKYSDILTGETSEIMNHYINQYYYSGTINIQRGYYYIGVKSLIPQTSYILNTYIAPQNQKNQLLLQNWQLQQINLKWYLKQNELLVTVVPLKTIDDSYQSDQPHVYTLYISNNLANLKLRTKCQILDKQYNVIVLKQNYTQNSGKHNIIFNIPAKNLYSNFSMFCKVEVNVSSAYITRIIPYYYNMTQQIITQTLYKNSDANNKSEKIYIIIISIIIGLLILLGLIYITKKLKILCFSPKVTLPFELTQLNSNKNQFQQKNKKIIYREFIDESKL